MTDMQMFDFAKVYSIRDKKCGYYGNEIPFKVKAISPLHALQCLEYKSISTCMKEACNCIVTDESGKEYYYHAYK